MHLSRPREIKGAWAMWWPRLSSVATATRSKFVQIPGGPLIVNPGSVGCPVYADGPDAAGTNARSPHVRYALLSRNNGRWSVEMFALAYDWERAALRALENNRP